MSRGQRSKSRSEQENTVQHEIKRREKAYVLFYATWCPYSQKFLPVFEKYSRSNQKDCISVIVDDNPDVCEEFGIEYYPTVILFKNGKVYKRLDAEPGVGLNSKQLLEFTEEQ